jgi:hypothetical protein
MRASGETAPATVDPTPREGRWITACQNAAGVVLPAATASDSVPVGPAPAGARARLALWLAVAAVAAGLRFYRLSWGLEDGIHYPDEWVWSRRGAAFVPLSCASFAGLHPKDRQGGDVEASQ